MPLQVPLDSSTCFDTKFNLSSILFLYREGLTHTILVAKAATSLSIDINNFLLNPIEVS